jgi:hypothetical protein
MDKSSTPPTNYFCFQRLSNGDGDQITFMNLRTRANCFSCKCSRFLTCAFIVVGFFLWADSALAQLGLASQPTNIVLQSWSFGDPIHWIDDAEYAPVSFTNLAYSNLGYGQTLVVDTNIPAWLKYNVVENDGTTNLTLNSGTVTFWFAPGSWTSTNAGGVGPGEYGRLLEIGSYTPESIYGLWSIYVDSGGNNLYFSAQTNDSSSNLTTYVCAPISWTTNYFHFVALTYCATNTTLYLDGVVATNGPGVTVYPGPNVLSNGFCIGSDTNGIYQAHGLFDLVQTYNYPLDSNDVQTIFNWYYPNFAIDPDNAEYMEAANLSSFSLSSTTNLAISPLTFSNNTASLFVVNSTADILYEVQGCTNLAQRNWFTEGFVLGSTLTNWTWANFYVSKKGDLFLRVRSWQDTTATGIPDWWWLQYFGQDTNVNPNAQDSAGDGWTLAQDFEIGWNPNTFRTPPAPQGVTVSYSSTTGMTTISWLPSPGNVTGYLITTSTEGSYSVSASSTNYTLSIPYSPNFEYYSDGDPTMNESFQIQAEYVRGNSLPSATVWLQPTTVSGHIIPGPSGGNLLAVANIPSNAATIRVFMFYIGFEQDNSENFTVETNVDIPVGNFINGFAPAYSSWLNLPTFPPNVNVFRNYFYLQSVDTNGNVSGGSPLTQDWGPDNFYDGREQLKQNLTFQFRVADTVSPFGFDIWTNYGNAYSPGFYQVAQLSTPTNYAYASFYDVDNYNGMYGITTDLPTLNTYRPFEDNVLYRDFVYTPSDVDTNGDMTTGVQLNNSFDTGVQLQLWLPPTYLPSTNNITVPLLGSSQYLNTYPVNGSVYLPNTFDTEGIAWPYNYTTNTTPELLFSNNIVNYWGLAFDSAELYYLDNNGSLENTVLSPGSSILTWSPNSVYMNTAQPTYRTIEYDFWNDNSFGGSPNDGYEFVPSPGSTTNLPGNSAFSTTNASQLLIVGVGENIGIAAFAKLEVTNSAYSGVYGYVQQYLTNAYQLDASGNVTTNLTGIVSPYGNYFATQAGAADVITMADLDTGQQGTDAVYAVSLNVDKNHDGTMDLSWNGPDSTSTNSPFVFWANNNYDRWTWDADDETNYMDDVEMTNCPYAPTTATPDYNYRDMYGNRVIPDTRDLEDYARLWVCGINAHLLTNLPAGSTVTLNWGDVGNANSNNPTIDLFQASDFDGGIEYSTNETSAANQINPVYSAYVGRVEPGQSVQLNSGFFSGWAGNHFIWCGVSNGTGGLTLTIADANSNILGQATVYIQIVDIKQMYERWTLGDQLSVAPLTNAILAADDGLPAGAPAFQYPHPQGTNTPYILFVHGWNMESWDKDRFAETAYKRLYWQGYQGRFGLFRWPTGNDFSGDFSQLLSNPTEKDNYDSSEYNALLSGAGLLNKLTSLQAEYPGHVYVLAHSMGNVVTGEALRLAGTNQVVNTYIASQAAVSAHTYDETVPNYSFNVVVGGVGFNFGPKTPNIYGDWFTGNNGGGAGRVISLYNTNDYALSQVHWQLDQLVKPDVLVVENGAPWNYEYGGSASDPAPWNDFFKTNDLTGATVSFNIVNTSTNRYEVMGYAAQSYTTALGATPNVENLTKSLNLVSLWPSPDPLDNDYASHFYHSAQFRGDAVSEWNYWNSLLFSSQAGFNISNP